MEHVSPLDLTVHFYRGNAFIAANVVGAKPGSTPVDLWASRDLSRQQHCIESIVVDQLVFADHDADQPIISPGITYDPEAYRKSLKRANRRFNAFLSSEFFAETYGPDGNWYSKRCPDQPLP